MREGEGNSGACANLYYVLCIGTAGRIPCGYISICAVVGGSFFLLFTSGNGRFVEGMADE